MSVNFKVIVEDVIPDKLTMIPLSPAIGSPEKATGFVSNPGNKVKAKDKSVKVLSDDPVSLTVPPGSCTLPGFTHTGAGTLTMQGDSQKSNTSVSPCFLEGYSKGVCSGQFTLNAVIPITIPCSCKILISEPGQDKVKSN